jgi:hypothetical protein
VHSSFFRFVSFTSLGCIECKSNPLGRRRSHFHLAGSNKLECGYKLFVNAEPSTVTATFALSNSLPVRNKLLKCRRPAVVTRSMRNKYRLQLPGLEVERRWSVRPNRLTLRNSSNAGINPMLHDSARYAERTGWSVDGKGLNEPQQIRNCFTDENPINTIHNVRGYFSKEKLIIGRLKRTGRNGSTYELDGRRECHYPFEFLSCFFLLFLASIFSCPW